MGLAHPVTSRIHERHGDMSLHIAVSSMCGFRRSMEDAHSISLRLPKHPDTCFVGVFDGHGGPLAARFCAEFLANRVDDLPDFSDENLKRVVMELDAEFCRPDNTEREHGTTCVFVLIQFSEDLDENGEPKTINIIACNTGDSRILTGNHSPENPLSINMTKDHKPTLDEERSRIMKAGGLVTGDRVDGDLALSRAIGDWKYKCNPELPAEQQKVIALPDVTRSTVKAGDYLLVACDGIFERLENLDVHNILQKSLCTSPDPMHAIESLLLLSLDAGSKDNMTACLIMLNPHSEYTSAPEMLFGPIHPEEENFMKTYTEFAAESGFGPQCDQFIEEWHKTHGTVPVNFDVEKHGSSETLIRELLCATENVTIDSSTKNESSLTPQ